MIHTVVVIDTAPQRHQCAGNVPFQGRQIAREQPSSTVSQNSPDGIDEHSHGADLISRKYCRTVPWTFVKQFGQ